MRIGQQNEKGGSYQAIRIHAGIIKAMFVPVRLPAIKIDAVHVTVNSYCRLNVICLDL